ncbi:hypothetical protein FNF28_01494 [Cafeteria roenbergensis]|uniref:histidine kinase n=1 Tax=Cafeteria roenbergensis TaxID=33653 RepID=A0A5A8DXS6_CAFRO|nr:hypothetical protein FNF28_01494 [Cafeteria roenbergensis]
MAQKSAPKAGCCDKRGRWFGFGIPVAVLLVTLGVALAVGASALAQSKQATTSSFRRAAVAAGAVLRASLGTQLDRLNAAGRAIEAFAPSVNDSAVENGVLQALSYSLTKQPEPLCLGASFARLTTKEEGPAWRAMIQRRLGLDAPPRDRFPVVNWSEPAPWTRNQSAFLFESVVPTSLSPEVPGPDLVSLSPGRERALRRGQLNRITLTEQVIGATSHFPVAFVYVPIFAPLALAGSPTRERGMLNVSAQETAAGTRVFGFDASAPRGIVPRSASHRMVGVLGCSSSSGTLQQAWEKQAGRVEDVQVLLQDMSATADACPDTSAVAATADARGPAVVMKSCRDGTFQPGTASPVVSAEEAAAAVTSDTGNFVEQDPAGDVTGPGCDDPTSVLMAITEDGGIGKADTSGQATSDAVAMARAQLQAACRTVQSAYASRAGGSLRYRAAIEFAGRRLLLTVAASAIFESANGELSAAVVYSLSVLAALVAGAAAYAVTSSLAEAEATRVRERERAILDKEQAAERLRVARAVHHTIVSYLAHEIRGGLSVASIGAGLAAEGLREDGLRLPTGKIIPPSRLLPDVPAPFSPSAMLAMSPTKRAAAMREAQAAAIAAAEDEDVYGAVTAAGLLRDLQRIQAASASSLRLIEDVLDIVGLETGKLAIRLAPLQPLQFARSIVDRYRPMCSVAIRLEVDSNVPQHILTDPLRCEQAVLNGLSNAIKHTKSGEIVLRVSVEQDMAVPPAWFRVRDKGLNFFEQAAASSGADDTSPPAAIAMSDEGGDETDSTSSRKRGAKQRRRGCCSRRSRSAKRASPSRRSTAGTRSDDASAFGNGHGGTAAGTAAGVSASGVPSFVGAPGAASAASSPPCDATAVQVAEPRRVAVRAQAPFVCFAVIDSGGGLGGINPEQLLRPFVTDNKKLNRGGTRVRSTGLGLPIAAQVAELVGGRVSLRDDGEGHTVYSLVVPVVPPRRMILHAPVGEIKDEAEALLSLLDSNTQSEAILAFARAEGTDAALLSGMGTGKSFTAASAAGAHKQPAPLVSGTADEKGAAAASSAASSRGSPIADEDSRSPGQGAAPAPGSVDGGSSPQGSVSSPAISASRRTGGGERERAGGCSSSGDAASGAAGFDADTDHTAAKPGHPLRDARQVAPALRFSGQMPPSGSGCSVVEASISPTAHSMLSGANGRSGSDAADHSSRALDRSHHTGSAGTTSSAGTSMPEGWNAGRGFAFRTKGVPAGFVAETQEWASEKACGTPFSGILMDIVMPQVNGDSLTRSLIARGLKVPVVAVTGNVAPTDVHRYSGCGFAAVLGKPLDRDAVMEMSKHTRVLSSACKE